MDRLRQFIHNNRSAFESGEMPEGHTARFNRKLDNLYRNERRYRIFRYGMAAVAAAAFLLVIFMNTGPGYPDSPDLCPTAAELRDVQLYYNIQLNDILEKIEKQPETAGNITKKQQIVQEALRILARKRNFENEIIPALPCTDNTVYVIDQYYSTTLRSFRFMLSRLEQEKTE